MEVEEYVRRASRTINPDTNRDERILNAALGLVGEAGGVAEIVANATTDDSLVTCVLDLSAKMAKIADLVKKHRYHGREFDRAKLAELARQIAATIHLVEYFSRLPAEPVVTGLNVRDELGDVQWYINQMCVGTGDTLEAVMQRNNEKLEERWPDGFVREDKSAA